MAAVLGCALGVLYGWAGAQLVLADLSATAGAGTAVGPAVPRRPVGLGGRDGRERLAGAV